MGSDSARPIWVYLLLTIALCAIPYALIGHSHDVRGGNGAYVVALMWGPATAAMLTVRWLKLDWASLGFAWRDTRSAWIGYLAPIGYAGIAYVAVWLSGLGG